VISAPIMMWVMGIFRFSRCPLSSDRTGAKQGVIAVAQRSLRPLRAFAQEDLVLLASIPDYPASGWEEVEMSKEAWLLVSAVVRSVTIAPESGASPMVSRLFPTENPVATAIDLPILLLSIELPVQSPADSMAFGSLRRKLSSSSQLQCF
jgi:hypothetical protein